MTVTVVSWLRVPVYVHLYFTSVLRVASWSWNSGEIWARTWRRSRIAPGRKGDIAGRDNHVDATRVASQLHAEEWPGVRLSTSLARLYRWKLGLKLVFIGGSEPAVTALETQEMEILRKVERNLGGNVCKILQILIWWNSGIELNAYAGY